MIEAVTFDFWNTLLFERSSLRAMRIEAWERTLQREGLSVGRDELERVLDESWKTFNAAWQANHQYRAPDAAALVLNMLGLQLERALRDELIELFITIGATADLPPAPNVEVALRGLRAAGVRVGIICDVGMTPSTILREHLEKHELLGYFAHWSFSDEVGVYKPHPQIFEHALAGLGGVSAERAAHVGDLRRTDVAGARAMGMTAVRYTGINDDPAVDELPEADVVIADHAELLAALGVTA